jgi:hypothetical protein
LDCQSLIVVLHVKNIMNHSANSSCSKPIQKSNPWRPSPSPGQEQEAGEAAKEAGHMTVIGP